ncbi:hypothetical protein BR93DRAFT_195099 [Coniochaeta sp. PMI_546]|nr:hypothetical protein BR93DRAFT_195099 [Coniochaeta sp. PMI_546]
MRLPYRVASSWVSFDAAAVPGCCHCFVRFSIFIDITLQKSNRDTCAALGDPSSSSDNLSAYHSRVSYTALSYQTHIVRP